MPADTLVAMDKVRFGRALGYGARHMAKAVVKAADAASTPAPVSSSAARPTPARQAAPAQQAVPSPTRLTAQQARAVGSQAKALGRSVWSPLARFSGTLWLQVTGTVYALVALSLGQAAWLHRAAMHLPASTHEAQRFYLLAAAFLLFAYFAVSAFVRAARR